MQFFILYKSFAYSLFESQILCDLAFLLSFHVPRLISEHVPHFCLAKNNNKTLLICKNCPS